MGLLTGKIGINPPTQEPRPRYKANDSGILKNEESKYVKKIEMGERNMIDVIKMGINDNTGGRTMILEKEYDNSYLLKKLAITQGVAIRMSTIELKNLKEAIEVMLQD